MAWFLRKARRIGPLRFNLSKGGVGFSLGVKGARVGVDARGRAYAAGGRGGLYFRERLGGGRSSGEDLTIDQRSAMTPRELGEVFAPCDACGHKVPTDAKQCPNCGDEPWWETRRKEEARRRTENATAAASATPTRRRILIVALLVLLVLLVVIRST